MTPAQLQDLLKIKQSLGIPDPRFGLKECELCDNDEWRPGVTCGRRIKTVKVRRHSGYSQPRCRGRKKNSFQAITDQIPWSTRK